MSRHGLLRALAGAVVMAVLMLALASGLERWFGAPAPIAFGAALVAFFLPILAIGAAALAAAQLWGVSAGVMLAAAALWLHELLRRDRAALHAGERSRDDR